ncbi:MAG: response regulator, partial [Vicinamibacterales bacterium]|nr:response regulator [Vicinamibacterales bacterium]
VMDVTTRRLADDALRSSEYFLGRSQEVGRLGSFEFDIPAGTWVCTATLDDILGLEHRNPKLYGEWVDRVAPDLRDDMLRYVTDHVLGGQNRFDREYRIVRLRDGVERWVFGLAEVEFDAAGLPLKMIGTIQDVTDRRRAEEERLALERRLQHSQKLESLGVLAGGIAHDFNNLLMAILGNLDLALSQISPVSAARASIEHSVTAARRATDLTRQMLAYSGKAAFDVRAVDLNEIVHENAHLLRACIPKLVHLTLDLKEPLHAIVADAGQVQQVIMNLITNAAEAIGDHAGVITLTTRMQDVDTDALRASRVEETPEPGMFVCLEVSDTGCGMDAHTQQRLFDPFFTTKLMGRGLGMSAILGIVRGHRGAIMVDSEPGTGSCIRVLFPAGDALPASALPARTGEPAGDAERTPVRGYVLVVDDEDMVRDVCRRMLQQAGWAVLDADGGQSAIDVYAAHADEVACVILDLSMPQMDGYGVFRALRAIRPDVRVILSSGYSRNHEPGTGLAAEGFAGFIQKPYAAKTLRDEVARVVTGATPR